MRAYHIMTWIREKVAVASNAGAGTRSGTLQGIGLPSGWDIGRTPRNAPAGRGDASMGAGCAVSAGPAQWPAAGQGWPSPSLPGRKDPLGRHSPAGMSAGLQMIDGFPAGDDRAGRTGASLQKRVPLAMVVALAAVLATSTPASYADDEWTVQGLPAPDQMKAPVRKTSVYLDGRSRHVAADPRRIVSAQDRARQVVNTPAHPEVQRINHTPRVKLREACVKACMEQGYEQALCLSGC